MLARPPEHSQFAVRRLSYDYCLSLDDCSRSRDRYAPR